MMLNNLPGSPNPTDKPAVRIAPSILAADFTRLGEHVREAEAGGADEFHFDVMDGHFVPNISMGPFILQAIRSLTALPLDVHLMIEKPERYLGAFAEAGATSLNVHVETCPHLHRTIQQIRDLGVSPGVAFNPHTPFEMIREILSDVDRVLVMTVDPGFGGQKLLVNTLHKVVELRQVSRILQNRIEVVIDGGVTPENAADLIQRGATTLIAGNSIFRNKAGAAAGIRALRP
jgi:ribulose-phosphate 3-epimerase